MIIYVDVTDVENYPEEKKQNIKIMFDRIQIECDDNDNMPIYLQNATLGETIDYGDEDCNKPVTSMICGEIVIKNSAAEYFRYFDVNNKKHYRPIAFIRYNYYRPAYAIYGELSDIEETEDGSLIYHYDKKRRMI